MNVLETYPSDTNDVKINLIHFEVGPLKKSDLELAETFDAVVYCFNLPANPTLEQKHQSEHPHHHHNHNHNHNHNQGSHAAQHESHSDAHGGVKKLVRHFNIIYKLFDDIKIELDLRAPLVEQEEKLGEAEVLKVTQLRCKLKFKGFYCFIKIKSYKQN